VTIHVLQGEREVASGNKSLGQFNLEGIPPSPRGMPQIEVQFDIDANGILHVSAKDKGTGKENKITIKANSGLSEAEIERMVQDAKANEEEDKKRLEIVQSKNTLDTLTHSVRKSLGEYGTQIESGEREKIEEALKDAEEYLKNPDATKQVLDAKAETLSTAAQKLGEKMYAAAQAEQAAAGASAEAAAGEAKSAGGKPGDDAKVVDADFTEVKDDKKKSA
jgi:molecular chaperone DnaK